jgi:hypothetical protein
MTAGMPHQIATRALGATVFITSIRDPADGTAKYAVTYKSRAVVVRAPFFRSSPSRGRRSRSQ